MTKAKIYRQCLVEQFGPNNSRKQTVGWMDDKHAKIGNVLKADDGSGFWRIKELYGKSNKLPNPQQEQMKYTMRLTNDLMISYLYLL